MFESQYICLELKCINVWKKIIILKNLPIFGNFKRANITRLIDQAMIKKTIKTISVFTYLIPGIRNKNK